MTVFTSPSGVKNPMTFSVLCSAGIIQDVDMHIVEIQSKNFVGFHPNTLDYTALAV